MAPRGPASRDFAVVTRDLAFQLRKDGRRKSSETPISMSRAHPLLLVPVASEKDNRPFRPEPITTPLLAVQPRIS